MYEHELKSGKTIVTLKLTCGRAVRRDPVTFCAYEEEL